MFNLGDQVKWISGANGKEKEKLGVVVEVVASGSQPNHESYVVKVKNKHYWPRAKAL
jgi:hypothetical protein